MSVESFSKNIAVSMTHEDARFRAVQIAKQLNLPVVSINDENFEFLLVVASEHLELKKTGKKTSGPLIIDFLHGAFGYRLRQKQKKELLAKAIGVKGKESLYVMDATAGLGRDGFLLATLGCKVLLLERSPIIEVLLQDGLRRALADIRYANLNINLIHTNALDYLQQLNPSLYPDVIYLDPMFPVKTKSALVKKELRYLQELVGADSDADQLLALALLRTKQRVVVKRPRLAKNLTDLKPATTIFGKDIRFDIYFPSKS